MQVKPGTILISAPSLEGDYFEQVVLVITEYNAKGAVGFVVNQLFGRVFNELTEFKNSLPFPLYEGGPVEQEKLFFIHQRPDLIQAGAPVTGPVVMGGDFKQAVQYINDKTLTTSDIKLFIGYSGWDPGQLEEEIAEGSWLVVGTPLQSVFDSPAPLLWESLYGTIN